MAYDTSVDSIRQRALCSAVLRVLYTNGRDSSCRWITNIYEDNRNILQPFSIDTTAITVDWLQAIADYNDISWCRCLLLLLLLLLLLHAVADAVTVALFEGRDNRRLMRCLLVTSLGSVNVRKVLQLKHLAHARMLDWLDMIGDRCLDCFRLKQSRYIISDNIWQRMMAIPVQSLVVIYHRI